MPQLLGFHCGSCIIGPYKFHLFVNQESRVGMHAEIWSLRRRSESEILAARYKILLWIVVPFIFFVAFYFTLLLKYTFKNRYF